MPIKPEQSPPPKRKRRRGDKPKNHLHGDGSEWQEKICSTRPELPLEVPAESVAAPVPPTGLFSQLQRSSLADSKPSGNCDVWRNFPKARGESTVESLHWPCSPRRPGKTAAPGDQTVSELHPGAKPGLKHLKLKHKLMTWCHRETVWQEQLYQQPQSELGWPLQRQP